MELEKFGERTQTKQFEDCILYGINYGPKGLKPNNFSDIEVYEDHNAENVMNDSVLRNEEEPVNINFKISEIQSKCFS